MLAGRITGGLPVALEGDALSDTSVTPTDSVVGYRLNSDGTEESFAGSGGSYSSIGDWLNGGLNTDWDCRLTVTGDAVAGSATASWLALTSSRAWTLTDSASSGSTLSNTCTIEISPSTDNTLIVASATVTMSVEESA